MRLSFAGLDRFPARCVCYVPAMKLNSGIGAAIGAAVLFGLSTPLAKLLLGSVSPLLLAGLMYLGSGLGLAAVLALRTATVRRTAITWPHGPAVGWLLAAIVSGGMLGPYLLMYGLRATDSASASLILNLEGVLTALLAWFVFKENFDRRIALGMGLIVAGGATLAIGPALRAQGLIGPLAICGACLAWAIDNNLTRKVSVHDAMFIACAKGLIAGASSVALALAAGARMPTLKVLLQAGSLGFVTYGLSLTLFVMALRALGTARTAAYFSLAPFIGALLAVAIGAPLTPALLFAGLLMAAGVWLHLTERHFHWHSHDPLRHEHMHVHDAHHRHRHGPDWDGSEPHSHAHAHEPLAHSHAHYPDIHHRHDH
jgi:drug/metabolite transporter (DMT)-like permease